MSKPPVSFTAVRPKPAMKFYHGHGHHHFEEGRVLSLPSDVAKRLIADGLVDPAAATADEPPAPAPGATNDDTTPPAPAA
jgi:hypothetical protein